MSGIVDQMVVRLATRTLPRGVERNLAKIDQMPNGVPGSDEATAKHIALGELAHSLLDSSQKRLDAKWVVSPAHQRRNIRAAGADAASAAEVLRRMAMNDALEPESQKQALLGAMRITDEDGLLPEIAKLSTSKQRVSQMESERRELVSRVGQLNDTVHRSIPEPTQSATALDARRVEDAEMLQRIEEQIQARQIGMDVLSSSPEFGQPRALPT